MNKEKFFNVIEYNIRIYEKQNKFFCYEIVCSECPYNSYETMYGNPCIFCPGTELKSLTINKRLEEELLKYKANILSQKICKK